jgi:hypothetical protein
MRSVGVQGRMRNDIQQGQVFGKHAGSLTPEEIPPWMVGQAFEFGT